jgi:hypothetical protein
MRSLSHLHFSLILDLNILRFELAELTNPADVDQPTAGDVARKVQGARVTYIHHQVTYTVR